MKNKNTKSKKADIRKGEDSFIIIEASKISKRADSFLQYTTRTVEEAKLKELLIIISKRGLEDFSCSVYQPSFTNCKCERIKFVKECKSNTRKSLYEWIRPIRRYYPKKYSRIANKLHYAALLGVIMKELVDEGWSKEIVWNAFCNDKKKIKDFLSKENGIKSERKIDLFYDLIMKSNILLDHEREDCYWITNRKEQSISYLSCEANEYAKGYEIPLIIMEVTLP